MKPAAAASPNKLGQTGLIHMPDGYIEPDGTWRIGTSYNDPYAALWTSVSLFPRLELSARYTEIDGFTAAPGVDAWEGYGDYKDKAFDAKLNLIQEEGWLPSLSIGTQDYLGTRLFPAEYAVISKRVGDVELTVGEGRGRLDGTFGGLRYRPSILPEWALVAEYDATDYVNDKGASLSGADKKEGGWTYGLEYKWGWLGAQLSQQGEDVGVNFSFSMPLMQRDYVLKIDEPYPDTQELERPLLDEWHQHERYVQQMILALERQGFGNVRVDINDGILTVNLAHNRISRIGRVAGRAARTVILQRPVGVEHIKIVIMEAGLPVWTYEISDTDKLQAFFDGKLDFDGLTRYASVHWSRPEEKITELKYTPEFDAAQREDKPAFEVKRDDAYLINIKSEDNSLSTWEIVPFNISSYFNDPSGAFKFDVFATATYNRKLGEGRYLAGGLQYTLWEDVSDVTQPSNSLLPHVRTDVADYKKTGSVKLYKLLLNQFFHPVSNVYGRLSAGLYEEMFGGVGGQLLYVPNDSDWAVDLTVDWLRQRDVGGRFDFREYETTTALAALHYRIPKYGITTTLRGGRFLAKDTGVRMEFKRRFDSGFDAGFWYTRTDGNDITGPGTPSSPYYDKGIFIHIPFATLIPKDTRLEGRASLSAWTRDVGQLVHSPADLYQMIENRTDFDSADSPLFFMGQ